MCSLLLSTPIYKRNPNSRASGDTGVYATTQAPGGDRGGVGGVSGVYVRYGIAEQQGAGVGTRVYLRVYEAGKCVF